MAGNSASLLRLGTYQISPKFLKASIAIIHARFIPLDNIGLTISGALFLSWQTGDAYQVEHYVHIAQRGHIPPTTFVKFPPGVGWVGKIFTLSSAGARLEPCHSSDKSVKIHNKQYNKKLAHVLPWKIKHECNMSETCYSQGSGFGTFRVNII